MDIETFAVGSLDSIFYFPSFLSTSEQAYFLHQVNSAPSPKWKTLKNRRLQNWGGVVNEKGLLAQSLPPWLASLTKRISTETGLFPAPINHVLVNEYEPGQGIMPHQDGPLYFPVVAIVSLGSPTVMRFVPHQNLTEAKETLNPKPTSLFGQDGVPEHGLPHLPEEESPKTSDQCRRKQEQGREEMSASFQQHRVPKDVSLILMPGSLLIFKDSAYQEYLHGIEDCVEHKLDATLGNAHMVMGGDKEQGSMNGADFPELCTVSRTGTRISLTCRLVPKVQKFLRL